MPPSGWKEVASVLAPEARQAAAADETCFYAIANTIIAKYDRATGQRVAQSTGSAIHLNSGFISDGKLYCAHSNYPARPEHSEIKILDPAKMELSTFKDFGETDGSLTWAVRRGEDWWCCFAYYGKENARTYVVLFDKEWKPGGRWTFPASVVERFGTKSASGGVWQDDWLLVTGHDNREIHVLKLPEGGEEFVHIATVPAPFAGQGIAHDPVTGGLVGVDRLKGRIVLAEGK